MRPDAGSRQLRRVGRRSASRCRAEHVPAAPGDGSGISARRGSQQRRRFDLTRCAAAPPIPRPRRRTMLDGSGVEMPSAGRSACPGSSVGPGSSVTTAGTSSPVGDNANERAAAKGNATKGTSGCDEPPADPPGAPGSDPRGGSCVPGTGPAPTPDGAAAPGAPGAAAPSGSRCPRTCGAPCAPSHSISSCVGGADTAVASEKRRGEIIWTSLSLQGALQWANSTPHHGLSQDGLCGARRTGCRTRFANRSRLRYKV